MGDVGQHPRHVGLAALREKFDATVAACRAIGIGQLFMPAVPPDQRGMDGVGCRGCKR